MFDKLWRKSCRLWGNVEKYSTARGHRHNQRTRIACWIVLGLTHTEYALLIFLHSNDYLKAPNIRTLLLQLRCVLCTHNLDYKIRDCVMGTSCSKYWEDKIIPCLTSRFRCQVDKNCVPLGFYERSSHIRTMFWRENMKERSRFEDLDGSISKLILKKFDGRVWSGFIWLRMESL